MRRFWGMLRSSSGDVLTDAEIRALSGRDLLAYALRISQHLRGDHAIQATPPSPPTVSSTTIAGPVRKKQRKELDWARYGSRMIALRLTYLGWDYHGFAAQPDMDNTVEAHLFAALEKTRLIRDRSSCSYSRAGRTDVGVSAQCQVVGLRVRSAVVPPSKSPKEMPYAKLLNAVLPDSIRVTSWAPVAEADGIVRTYVEEAPHVPPADDEQLRRPGETFSARFDAHWRAYRYYFMRGTLNLDDMRRAASYFVGDHDFRNFCKVDKTVTNFRRLLYQVELHCVNGKENDGVSAMWYVYVRGQAFLWHQVRCMVAVLFQVGRGELQPDVIRDMLQRNGKYAVKPSYRMACPTPLVLHECAYPASVVQFPPRKTLPGVSNELATIRIFAELSLKRAVVCGMLEHDDETRLQFGARDMREFTLDGSGKYKRVG